MRQRLGTPPPPYESIPVYPASNGLLRLTPQDINSLRLLHLTLFLMSPKSTVFLRASACVVSRRACVARLRSFLNCMGKCSPWSSCSLSHCIRNCLLMPARLPAVARIKLSHSRRRPRLRPPCKESPGRASRCLAIPSLIPWPPMGHGCLHQPDAQSTLAPLT